MIVIKLVCSHCGRIWTQKDNIIGFRSDSIHLSKEGSIMATPDGTVNKRKCGSCDSTLFEVFFGITGEPIKKYWEKKHKDCTWEDFFLFWEDNFNWFREIILRIGG